MVPVDLGSFVLDGLVTLRGEPDLAVTNPEIVGWLGDFRSRLACGSGNMANERPKGFVVTRSRGGPGACRSTAVCGKLDRGLR